MIGNNSVWYLMTAVLRIIFCVIAALASHFSHCCEIKQVLHTHEKQNKQKQLSKVYLKVAQCYAHCTVTSGERERERAQTSFHYQLTKQEGKQNLWQ